MKTIHAFTVTILSGFLLVAGPASAHFTINEGGTESASYCSGAKALANLSIQTVTIRHTLTSRHIGKCEKHDDEYFVDWSVTGYDTLKHSDADHTHSGRSSGDAHGTDSYGD